MTTCKRLDLFIATMSTFLNSCQDIDLIDRFVVIDDNSDQRDRQMMSRLFPFIEFIWKTPEQSGHPKSMNMLRELVIASGATYWMHMEDDFLFFKPRSFIEPALQIMSEQASIGQVLFNRHYGESPRIEHDKGVGQAFCEQTQATNTEFIRHVHWNTETESSIYHAYTSCFPMIQHQNGGNHSYWEGFSFRPSILRVEMLVMLGPFSETGAHFERQYAVKAHSSGWQSAFFNDFCCEHVGRLTSERFDPSIKNAYVLNDQKQFSE